MQVSADVQNAYKAALLARSKAHAPYSKFKVGAALKLKGQPEPVAGCNVENASFGATMCAERSALFGAVSRFGKVAPEFLVIVTGEPGATVPCGLCLQALAEFCADEMDIYLGNESQLIEKRRFKDFLPRAFRSFEST
jgi:cytidine deaminase